MATLAPFSRNRRALARPIPLPPPGTRTTLFCRGDMKGSLRNWGIHGRQFDTIAVRIFHDRAASPWRIFRFTHDPRAVTLEPLESPVQGRDSEANAHGRGRVACLTGIDFQHECPEGGRI